MHVVLASLEGSNVLTWILRDLLQRLPEGRPLKESTFHISAGGMSVGLRIERGTAILGPPPEHASGKISGSLGSLSSVLAGASPIGPWLRGEVSFRGLLAALALLRFFRQGAP